MSTQAEVRQQIGEDLGLVPIGQILEAQDQSKIDKAISAGYKRLKSKGYASWASTGDIPDEVVPYFCLLVEQALLVSYSVPDSRYVRITTAAGPDGSIAIGKIADMVTQDYESTNSYQDY